MRAVNKGPTVVKAVRMSPFRRQAVTLTGEVRTSDRHIVAYQSRPLPDGATLIAFADITDTRELEKALVDRARN